MVRFVEPCLIYIFLGKGPGVYEWLTYQANLPLSRPGIKQGHMISFSAHLIWKLPFAIPKLTHRPERNISGTNLLQSGTTVTPSESRFRALLISLSLHRSDFL